MVEEQSYFVLDDRTSRKLTMLRWLRAFMIAISRRTLRVSSFAMMSDLSRILMAYSSPVSWCVASFTFPNVPCPRVDVTMYCENA